MKSFEYHFCFAIVFPFCCLFGEEVDCCPEKTQEHYYQKLNRKGGGVAVSALHWLPDEENYRANRAREEEEQKCHYFALLRRAGLGGSGITPLHSCSIRNDRLLDLR